MDLPDASASATLIGMTFSDQIPAQPTVISTGSLRLDLALGSGGLPHGCLVEIAGPLESGKTTLCLQLAAAAQAQGGLCAWVDADQGFEAVFAASCGLDLRRCYLSQPQYAEQGLDTLQILLASGAFSLVALDSLDGLVPLAEINTRLGEAAPKPAETLLSRWLPRLTDLAQSGGTIIVITRRSETQISGAYHHLKANPARMALSLSAGVSLQLAEPPAVLERPRLAVRVVKNQYAPYIKTAELDIIVNSSINKTGEMLELAQSFGIITWRDGCYYYQSQALGAGIEEADRYLNDHPQVAEQLAGAVRQAIL